MAPEVARFIRRQPREWGYARLAEMCRAEFGAANAPDAEAIRDWWLAERAKRPRHGRLAKDAEVMEAVRDLAGRADVAHIARVLAARFEPSRLPSRSALYRACAQLLRPVPQAALRTAGGSPLREPRQRPQKPLRHAAAPPIPESASTPL